MCELKIISNGRTLMEDVVRITSEGDDVMLTNIMGEKKKVRGKLIDVNLTKQEAILK